MNIVEPAKWIIIIPKNFIVRNPELWWRERDPEKLFEFREFSKYSPKKYHNHQMLQYLSLCFYIMSRHTVHPQRNIIALDIYKPSNYLFFFFFFRVASNADVVRVTLCIIILVTGGASNSLDAFNKPKTVTRNTFDL